MQLLMPEDQKANVSAISIVLGISQVLLTHVISLKKEKTNYPRKVEFAALGLALKKLQEKEIWGRLLYPARRFSYCQ
jgi:hypothetical protein